MELYERIEAVIQQKKTNKKNVATLLGIPHNTFGRYFCLKHQRKLGMLLWDLAALWPDVSRDWLYFGEGEMLSASPTAAQVNELKAELDAANAKLDTKDAEIERLRSELDEANRLNRTLTAKLLLGDSTEDSAGKSKKNSV